MPQLANPSKSQQIPSSSPETIHLTQNKPHSLYTGVMHHLIYLKSRYKQKNPATSRVFLFAGALASIEALTGLTSFAIITGIMYGRFSRPRAYLRFSRHALIAPYHDITGLMFRFVSYKENHNLTNVEVTVTFGLTERDGTAQFKFYQLPLERSRIDSLPMNWTVVHPINEGSPLHVFTE